MMLTAWPPFVTIPMDANAVAKVNALAVDEAEGIEARGERAGPGLRRRGRVRGVPRNSNTSHSDASVGCSSRSRSKGWNIIAASIPSNIPALIIFDLAAAALLGRGS